MRKRDDPVSLTPTSAASLRADLADWTVDAVGELLGERALGALAREQLIPAQLVAAAAGREPLAVLTRLFMLGEELRRGDVDAALASLGSHGAIAAGLVHAAGASADDAVRACVDLRPYATAAGGEVTSWWVASDLGEAVTGAVLADDHVLGIGGASTTLASATMRTPVGSVLDLGTGSGIQALHASEHASRVVATDISARALAFARFNEALNAPRTRWDLRQGSLLEPVAHDSFDLVVSNPPFVITPPGAPSFEYRDGGAAGDGLVASLVSSLGTVLAPGGVAQLLGNWEVAAGADWRERVTAWIEASAVPLDAWVIQRDTLDVAAYAETWLRDAGLTPDRDRRRFEDAYRAYLRDFDSRGVEAVGFGLLVLRRPVGAPSLRRLEDIEGPLPMPLGPHLAASLAAHDWLAARTDDEVLAERWVVAGDVTVESYAFPGAEHPSHILLRQGGAWGRAVKADTALAGFVGACDGELTGGQLASAIAALLDEPAAAVASGLAAAIKELALDGFVNRFNADTPV